MKVKELIELIDNSEETLYCLDDFEDPIDNKCKKVASNLDINELSDWDRVNPDITVSEYEEVQISSYQPKKCQS